MVYIKTCIFTLFYWQYLVLLTMVPRDTWHSSGLPSNRDCGSERSRRFVGRWTPENCSDLGVTGLWHGNYSNPPWSPTFRLYFEIWLHTCLYPPPPCFLRSSSQNTILALHVAHQSSTPHSIGCTSYKIWLCSFSRLFNSKLHLTY